ncbi:MAG TPA: exodeoxyribonuclease III [Crocinitomix sp.]|nr:exodeoxyribonuclease III [Crocinitomix sp.]
MKITTWNINGIRAIINKDFEKTITEIESDMICLQETKAQDDQVEKAIGHIEGYNLYSYSAEKKGYSGTAILSKLKPINVFKGMKHLINSTLEIDTEGRVLTAEYEAYFLVNVYVPNAGQGLKRLAYKEQWNKVFLKYLIKLNQTKPIIVCGDFNVAHQPIDLKNDKSNYNKTAGYTQVEIDGMTNMLSFGLVDIYRELNPDKEEYTYWSYRFKARERNTGWRIDYFLISKELKNKVLDIKILNQYYGSDHCPVVLELKTI